MIPEVCIYFSGKVLRGNSATKQNADEFNAFDTFNYPHLCEAGVNFTFHAHHILKPDFTKPMIPHKELNPCWKQYHYCRNEAKPRNLDRCHKLLQCTYENDKRWCLL